jgi:hypothetical protein
MALIGMYGSGKCGRNTLPIDDNFHYRYDEGARNKMRNIIQEMIDDL